MFWYDHQNMNGWGYAGMGIGMVLFWGLIIAAIVVLIRLSVRSDQPPRPTTGPSAAEQLLAQRFARGDIDEREYADRLTTLRTHSANL
ncbi:SHOCT domain-containing protein [Nocardia uniformis]|uniref:SHOCT domain-containing protein n=2 Tax=Nocardia uniformis TaxID=53432 RepID=A0A849BWD9_9NOCA|nr:SHOCT domain-containing protein [Nocardia uniformis]